MINTIDLITHMADCDRGINWCTELAESTELFTVLNSNNLTSYKIDRRKIGDQHHLYHHMTRIQIT